MKAKLLFKRRVVLTEDSFVELLIWEVPKPVSGSTHCYKYGLAFVQKGDCILRYDNEAGKGDHKHIGNDEVPYIFKDVDQLIADFLADVRRWKNEHSNT